MQTERQRVPVILSSPCLDNYYNSLNIVLVSLEVINKAGEQVDLGEVEQSVVHVDSAVI